MGVFTSNDDEADIFIFNSYQYWERVIELKYKFPDKIFLHRVDGPIRLYNKKYDLRDIPIYLLNKYIADGTIFQSHWSLKECQRIGLGLKNPNKVINNAVDSSIFYPKQKLFLKNQKIRLISVSWSDNPNKGLDVFQWLDNNLDFNLFEYVFIGRVRSEFKNIIHIPAISSIELSENLRVSDIFISGSRIEACSNALIEAINCGLPVIAPSSSSNPEIIGKNGLLFQSVTQIPELIDKISSNYSDFILPTHLSRIGEVAKSYYSFGEKLKSDLSMKRYRKKLIKKELLILNLKFIFYVDSFLRRLINKYAS